MTQLTQFIIFILASTGLTLVLVKSKLFMPIRVKVTNAFLELKDIGVLENRKLKVSEIIRLTTLWFLDSILNCSLCMGVWTSLVCAILVWLNLWMVLWVFAGIAGVGLLTKIYSKWGC